MLAHVCSSRWLAAGILGAALLSGLEAGAAGATVLYDGGLGTVPSAQGWGFVATPLFGAQAKQSASGGGATLDTRAVRTDKAGWFSNLPPFAKHPAQPPLPAETGFMVSFSARVKSEDHASADRAGFSVIVTASNLSAIELGFWTGEIWAQSGADFRHAEGQGYDTTARLVRYDLEIHGGRYRLSGDGASILEGELRRYDGFGAPYNIPEFLFFGDDTTSAQAEAELGRVVVTPLPALTVTRKEGGMELAMEAETGREVAFEGSTDLVSWSAVGTSTSVAGTARWMLDGTTEAGGRFFRARLH